MARSTVERNKRVVVFGNIENDQSVRNIRKKEIIRNVNDEEDKREEEPKEVNQDP